DRRLIGVLLLDDDPVRLEREVGPVTAERALHQELERRLRALELESLVLERLELIEDPARVRRVLVEVDPVFARLPKNVRLARQFRHEHAPMVADRLRVDVLVGLSSEERSPACPGGGRSRIRAPSKECSTCPPVPTRARADGCRPTPGRCARRSQLGRTESGVSWWRSIPYSRAFQRMFDLPASSDTSTRRWLPTDSGSMCS